jgi:hypothetical protein
MAKGVRIRIRFIRGGPEVDVGKSRVASFQGGQFMQGLKRSAPDRWCGIGRLPFDARQVTKAVKHHNCLSTFRFFVDPGIACSSRGLTTLLQHLIFVGALSLACADDVTATARGVSESGFQ